MAAMRLRDLPLRGVAYREMVIPAFVHGMSGRQPESRTS